MHAYKQHESKLTDYESSALAEIELAYIKSKDNTQESCFRLFSEAERIVSQSTQESASSSQPNRLHVYLKKELQKRKLFFEKPAQNAISHGIPQDQTSTFSAGVKLHR